MSLDARFVGSIPEYYDRHLGPVLFESPAEDLAVRLELEPGCRVLEVACGTGITTRRLLARLPEDGVLFATDLNEPMLAHARARVPGDSRLAWRVADAMALPFDPGSFDAYVCQFGVMFFPDKPAAMYEARRVLAPGARLLFSVWCDHASNAFGRIADRTIASFFDEDPPTFYRTPFGWCDEDTIRRTLDATGFREVSIEPVELPTTSASVEDFAAGIVRGNPVLLEIEQRASADVASIEAAVARDLAREGGERPWRGTLRALMVQAIA